MTHTRRLPAAFLLISTLVLLTPALLVPSRSWGQAAEGAPAAPATPNRPAVAATDPARTCYEAARKGSRDAYGCDLAVQMARDSGDPGRLAAALANRSLVLAADGRLQPALADVDEALALTPDAADLHGNRGNLLLRLNRPAEALNAHGRAIELSPEDPIGYYNRAFSYLALGQPQRAERDVSAARDLQQSGGVTYR
ncbi:MAG: tetratricopeptide repeat protein [Pseudomonadales bacterium]